MVYTIHYIRGHILPAICYEHAQLVGAVDRHGPHGPCQAFARCINLKEDKEMIQ